MTVDRDAISEVTAANERFYRAFESLNVEQMARVWVQDDTAQVIHPGWSIKLGWDEVRDSWAAIFANTRYMEFHLTDVHVLVSGPWARVTCVENLRSVAGGQENMGQVQATNLFHPNGRRLVNGPPPRLPYFYGLIRAKDRSRAVTGHCPSRMKQTVSP